IVDRRFFCSSRAALVIAPRTRPQIDLIFSDSSFCRSFSVAGSVWWRITNNEIRLSCLTSNTRAGMGTPSIEPEGTVCARHSSGNEIKNSTRGNWRRILVDDLADPGGPAIASLHLAYARAPCHSVTRQAFPKLLCFHHPHS